MAPGFRSLQFTWSSALYSMYGSTRTRKQAKTESQNAALQLPRAVRGEIEKYERTAASEANIAVSRNDHILARSVRCSKPRSLPGTTLLTHGRLKVSATPTNSNAHVSPVGSKIFKVRARHTLRIRTPSSGVAKLGHTGARALATRGCAPPVQALLKIIGVIGANDSRRT